MLQLAIKLLGRDLAWRLGRSLYMAARNEVSDETVGASERLLIDRITALHKRSGAAAAPLVMVDCGANIGLWTEMALASLHDLGATGTIHMFEPSPGSHRYVSEKFDGVDRLLLHQTALSDRNGTADFHMIAPTGGINSLVADPAHDAETITVATARGDDFFPSIGVSHIALIKSDTEGHDFAVLCGCERLFLERRIDVAQFEYNHRWLSSGQSMRSVFAFAERVGYRVGRASADRIDIYAGWNPENDRFFEWNYLLVAPDMVTKLGCREVRWSNSNTLVDV